ncbi:MAG: polysaccharide biosynthesis C-terminal domain-containing protein [Bacteroidales bacterium]|nr:polysaccharide biosynthesis C-terminal domain-containing protein [Bacteroidales bacterium]
MIKKILHTFLTKIVSAIIGFLAIILISQSIGAEGKGEQSIFLFNMVIIMLFATLVGNSTLIYLTPRHKFSELFFPSIVWIVLSIIILFLVLSLIPNLLMLYPLELFIIAFLASITEVNTFVLIGKEKVREANNLKLLSQIISIIFLFLLFLLDKFNGSYIYVISLLIGYSISLLFGIYLLRDEYRKLQIPIFKDFVFMLKKLFHLGAIKQVGSISQQMNARLSFYLIAFYSSKKALGVFSNGISISEAVLMFGISLALVQYSKLSNTQDEAYARRISLLMTKVNIIFTILALAFFSILPAQFYTYLFGQEFGDIRKIIQILSLGILLLSISSTFTQHFASKGNFTIATTASLFGLLATGLFGFILVPAYGIFGAAITTVISYGISFSIEYYYFKKWTSTKFKDFLISKEDIREFKSLINGFIK